MKKRKPRKPRDWHDMAWVLKDVDGYGIYLSRTLCTLDFSSANSLGKWLLKAAKWAKAQEAEK